MEQAEAQRTEECKRIEGEKARLRDALQNAERRRRTAATNRDRVAAEIRGKNNELRDLQRILADLVLWTTRRDQPGEHDELHELRQKLDATESETARLARDLGKLLRRHDENQERLATIFSAAARTVLSAKGYDGKFTLENREPAFRITHGPAMSGEAVETLAVLLADVSSLIYSTVTESACFPGILVHDSPREADLGLRIYRSFIRLVGSLQDHFGDPDKCPFQYFITTTTPPPEELQGDKYVKLRLDATRISGLLLKRNVADVPGQEAAPMFAEGTTL
jgi:hypothetical protein